MSWCRSSASSTLNLQSPTTARLLFSTAAEPTGAGAGRVAICPPSAGWCGMDLIDLLRPWVQRGNDAYRVAIAKLAARTGATDSVSAASPAPDPSLFAYFADPACRRLATL